MICGNKMKIVVCVKQAASGEINPFDACAYEAALRIKDAQVLLLSMGPERSKDFLLELTRLGAQQAYLLCDKAFAGADTLATAYTLSLAIKKLQPDLVFCGRQTVDGDTGQTGPSLARMAGLSLIANVMEIENTGDRLICTTRDAEKCTAAYPTLLTVERIHQLRLPSIRSKRGSVTLWDAETLQADVNRCGTKGSPTKVLKTFQNEEGKRKCTFVEPAMLESLIEQGIGKEKTRVIPEQNQDTKLKKVWIVGEKCREMAESISDDITLIPQNNTDEEAFIVHTAEQIKAQKPAVVLWDSTPWSKRIAPQVAALLKTGLCADCTALETDGDHLYMYRPAFSGNVIAKIACVTMPQMATVRTLAEGSADVICAMGRGAKAAQNAIEAYVANKNQSGRALFETAASRGAVDMDMLPYPKQVGLTGKRVSPGVYLAIGISGAVHHITGMQQSSTVIAINPDPDAEIFDYADFGIVATAEVVFGSIK